MFEPLTGEGASLPLGEQVYRVICREIENGELKKGDKLPSRRAMAEVMRVSTTTVETAYGRLIEEGICESRPRSGIYVVGIQKAPDQETEKEIPVLYDFGIGAMDAEQFPYSTWAKLMREVLSEQSDELLRTGNPQGSLFLRTEITRIIRKMRGVSCDPDQVVIGAGTDVLVAILIALIGRERLFAVEDPGYARARRILVAGGARIVPIPLSEGAVNIRELYQSGAGAAYVTPGRQFPTGQEMNGERRKNLMNWARETGAYILEDDYESEFRFGDNALPALFSSDANGRVIYMNTFARTLAPGLRISYMILPKVLCSRYLELYSACSVPGFEQAALGKFIQNGYYERHVNRMRVIYRQRLRCLEEGVARLGLGELHKNNAGLFELLQIPGNHPMEDLLQKARKAGIYMTVMSNYSVLPGPDYMDRTVLLGLAGMDEEKISEGLVALRKVWHEVWPEGRGKKK